MKALLFSFTLLISIYSLPHANAQMVDLSAESQRQRDALKTEYPPEPWEIQSFTIRHREYQKPIQLSTSNNRPEATANKAQLKNEEKAQLDSIYLPNPVEKIRAENPKHVRFDSQEKDSIPQISKSESINENVLPFTAENDIESTEPIQSKDLNPNQTPIITKALISKPDEAIENEPNESKPVITSLNKNIPSLTSFKARGESSTPIYTFDYDSYLNNQMLIFPGIPSLNKWKKEAAKTPSSYTPETIQEYRNSWRTPLLLEMKDSIQHSWEKMRLNDGGVYLYTAELARQIYPENLDAAKLLTSILMQELGFRVHCVIQQKEISLLVNTRQKLYEVPRLQAQTFESEEWYLWQAGFEKDNSGDIISPRMGEVNALHPIDLNMYQYPNLEKTYIEKIIPYSDPVTKTKDTFSIKLNTNYLKFLGALPQMSPDVYFNATISKEFYETLIPQIKNRVASLRSYEALGWLLRFVQNAFPYRTDETQFGKEKAMFAEEALFYPYTDCEDRSVLFAVLVKEVLNRNVIGLDFPGHMAVGVQTHRKEARGAMLRYNGNIYMACDPSYKRAIPGTLPDNILKHSPVPIDVRKIK